MNRFIGNNTAYVHYLNERRTLIVEFVNYDQVTYTKRPLRKLKFLHVNFLNYFSV